MADNLRFELVSTDEGFWALKTEWLDLLQNSAYSNIFITWEWISAWWATFSEGRQLWVHAARHPDTGQLLGLAPLTLRHRTAYGRTVYRELKFMGTDQASPDHLDFLVRTGYEEPVAAGLVRSIWDTRNEWDILRLDGLTSESLLVKLFLDQAQPKAHHLHRVSSPFIRLPTEWETYRSSLSKNMRYNIGRYGRRLEKLFPGQVVFRQVEREQELEPAMASLFDLHREVREAKGGRGVVRDPRQWDFHLNAARLFLHNDWLRLYLLTIEGEDIAALYCYRYEGIVSFYRTGYRLSWTSHGPGRQLMAYAIRRSIEEQAQEFDFLRGDEPYKFQWTDDARDDCYLRIPSSLVGRCMVSAYSIARNLKHTFRAKPGGS